MVKLFKALKWFAFLTVFMSDSSFCMELKHLAEQSNPADAKQAAEKERIKQLSYNLEALHGFRCNNEKSLELFEQGADPNIFKERAPLVDAAWNKNTPLVKALLNKKADPNVVDKRRWTPLGKAIGLGFQNSESITCITLLIKAGARITSNWYESFGGMRRVQDAMYERDNASTLIPLFKDLGVYPRTATIITLLKTQFPKIFPQGIALIVTSYIPYQEDICDAIEQHDEKSFHEFLSSPNMHINERGHSGETPLTCALIAMKRSRSPAICNMTLTLLNSGASFFMRAADGRLPMDIIKTMPELPHNLQLRVIGAKNSAPQNPPKTGVKKIHLATNP